MVDGACKAYLRSFIKQSQALPRAFQGHCNLLGFGGADQGLGGMGLQAGSSFPGAAHIK